MAGAQISTSVSIFGVGLLGFIGVSLTNYETSGLSAIAAGSCVEIGGAFFNFPAQETINASSWSAIASAANAYLALTPSGTAGSQILTASWVANVPVWSESKQGWYASAGSITRVIGSAYKVSATQQETKTLYVKGRDRIFTKKIEIGSWNMVSTYYKEIVVNTSIPLSAEAFIIKDGITLTNIEIYPINYYFEGSTAGGLNFIYYLGRLIVNLLRTTSGRFDSTDYNDTANNRGYVIITYEA
jgi:hypothetical protein